MRAENSDAALEAAIARGAEELGLKLPRGAVAAFREYFERLEAHGANYNLTAISGEDDVARLHILDSLALLKTYRFDGARVIDVGSGAGFPGVPIKLAAPSVNLTLLDATGKRVAFLKELCPALGIEASCIHARAEEASRGADHRERYDIALSRAVARLDVLCELCLPFVRVGGAFIAMKGADSDNEIAGAGGAVKALGAKVQECADYTIPGTDVARRAVIIKKVAKTHERYPRRFARIQKNPLK